MTSRAGDDDGRNDGRNDGPDDGRTGRTERALEIFADVLELEGEARERAIRQRAGSDEALIAEVRGLLGSHDTEGVLDRAPERPAAAVPGAELRARLADALGDRYRIVDSLGEGGMAVVFLAWERKHDRRVVLKVLRPEVATLYGEERFLEEIRFASGLSHPHILAFIDSGRAGGLLYYVMPHVEGETLAERIRRARPGAVADALPLLRDVADALAHAHERGVVHRDLKPANVLCAGRHAYLMDFGVAKALGDRTGGDLTRPGVVPGTPRYMAPEQLEADEGIGPPVDVFAWGQLAHEALTGEVVTPPWTVAPTLDTGGDDATLESRLLRDLVAASLSVDPAARPTAESLRAELDRLTTAQTAVPPGNAGHVRRRLAGVGAALLAGALGYVALSDRTAVPAEGSVPSPIAVAEFRNETGDASLDFVGRMAGDWVTQGLQTLGSTAVVPWPMALEASRRARADSVADPVPVLRRETGAAIAVTGAFYRVGEELRFQAEIVDAAEGRVLSAPLPLSASVERPTDGVGELRDRIMGSVAALSGGRAGSVPGLAARAPRIEAYRAFDRGLERYLAQEYTEATPEFLLAYDLDTTFHTALLYGATTAWNQGDRRMTDSLLRVLEPGRDRMSDFDDLRWQFLDALLRSDAPDALRSLRRAAALAPASRASYNLALIALSVNRPGEAMEAVESLDPDAGAMRGWAQYWTVRAHALHLLERHDEEAEAAREMARRHPERTVAPVFEVRALAAAGREEALAPALEASSTRPPRTYWSHGAALTVAGEELLAHHGPARAEPHLERALAWTERWIGEDSTYLAHRYWRGSALYDLERWAESFDTFEALVRDAPTNDTYLGMAAVAAARLGRRDTALAHLGGDAWLGAEGERLAYEARIEAILGDLDRAFVLLSEAFERGIDGWEWLHASAYHDLEILRRDPRIARLLEPGDG